MPRYVILRHETPPDYFRPLHWDFLLESGEVLRAWAIFEEPRPHAWLAAVPLPDHRPLYLDYEGSIAGGRGVVARWDAGTYTLLNETEHSLEARLVGRQWQGVVKLRRESDGADQRWSVWFEPVDSNASGD